MKRCVLVVDDAQTMRGLISMTLKNAGYDVIEAGDGVEALEKMAKTRVHMVMADMNMPNMNGIEMLKRIKANPGTRFIPVVILSTMSDPESKRQGQEAGAKAWIVKPFKPATVVSVVKKVIG